MKWIETEIKIKDLKDFEKNPRKITKEQLKKLVRSIEEDGYHQRILVDFDNTIIGGHARKKALKAAGFKDNDVIKVLKPEHKLSQEEFERINIRDNGVFGSWDMDILANNFDFNDLIELGVPSKEFTDLFAKVPEIPDLLPPSEINKTWKIEIDFLSENQRNQAVIAIENLGYKCILK